MSAGQSKAQSAAEVLTNTFTGLFGSWLITYAAMQSITDRASAATVTVIGCTAWSLARGWVIRRTFNRAASGRQP